MKYMLLFFTALAVSGLLRTGAQVKITDGADTLINTNSILELESNNKGLLIPRVLLNSITSATPLSAPVPEGMMVYSTGGALPNGFYYWGGSMWVRMAKANSDDCLILMLSRDTLLPKENSTVFAMKDITLTLPAITQTDTCITISVKNTGTPLDLITVRGSGTATIDGESYITIQNTIGVTFISNGGKWYLLNRVMATDDILDVGPDEVFKTLTDALGFLKEHMDKPMIIRLGGETMYLSETQIIDLPYPLTIQGSTYGAGTIAAGPGLTGKPMFRCKSESYFKMLIFDATTLSGYGTLKGEDAIRYVGAGTYNEIKDAVFYGFYNTVTDSTDAELWIFESDIFNSHSSAILMQSNIAGAKIRTADLDFFYNKKGVHLSEGTDADVQIQSAVFTNGTADTAISYNPNSFKFNTIIIVNNTCNNGGTGLSGFDFSRADGRDANCYIENNIGLESNKPHLNISVVNNLSTFLCSTPGVWYKANWTNTTSKGTNFRIENNKFTYQPRSKRALSIFISGNVLVDSNNRVITVGMVKNGNATLRYGESALRVTVANQPFQFSTIIHVDDVGENDYFELFASSSNYNDVLTFQDINIYVSAE